MCLGNKSSCFFKYLENVFYHMLSWRKVQAGVPSPSHFSKVLLCFQNQVQSGQYLQGHSFLPYPFGWKALEYQTQGLNSCSFSGHPPPRPPRPPSWSGKKGNLLTCGVSEGTFLPTCPPGELRLPACSGYGCHRRAVGSGNFSWISPPGGKGMEAQGSKSCWQKVPETKASPQHPQLVGSVPVLRQQLAAQVPVLTWQGAKGLSLVGGAQSTSLCAQLSSPPHTHTHNRICPILCKSPFLAHPYVSRTDLIVAPSSHNQHFLQRFPITTDWTL